MAVITQAATEVLARGDGWGHGGWWPIFPLLWLLFFGVVIFALFRSRRGWARWHAGQSAEGVLGERYARGEIGEDEYRERLTVLRERPKSN
jgi:putative membrane protein